MHELPEETLLAASRIASELVAIPEIAIDEDEMWRRAEEHEQHFPPEKNLGRSSADLR